MADSIQLLGSKYSFERTGIVRATTMWTAADAGAIVDFIRSHPSFFGLGISKADADQDDSGFFVITAVYEGIPDDSQNPAGGASDGANSGLGSGGTPLSLEGLYEFNFDGAMEKTPVPAHPNFEKLKKKYGWDDDKEQFPLYQPVPGTSWLGGDAPAVSLKKSSLALTDAFYEVGAEYSVTYARRDVPGSVTQGIGTIVVPRGISGFSIPKGRNFLKLAPQIRKRGNCVEIKERFVMSGVSGWNKDLYTFGQLDA